MFQWFGFLVIILLALPVGAEEKKEEPGIQEVQLYEFKDDATNNKSFVEFRKKLKAAVKRRDTSFIKEIMAEDISCSIEDKGKKHCIEILGLDKNASMEMTGANFWSEFEKILKLGSMTTEDAVQIPYSFEYFDPQDDKPNFSSMGVVLSKTLLRRKPIYTSPALRDMRAYEIITLLSVAPESWQKIKTYDNLQGYVQKKELYSLSNYWATFSKIKGEWKMTAFSPIGC